MKTEFSCVFARDARRLGRRRDLTLRDAALRTRGPGINRQRGTEHTPTRRDCGDKIRRDEPATNYRGYWSVIDCSAATPRAFLQIAEERSARRQSDYAGII